MLARITSRIVIAQGMCRRGDNDSLQKAVETLSEAKNLLMRGIHCGALVDPWNILGFCWPVSTS